MDEHAGIAGFGHIAVALASRRLAGFGNGERPSLPMMLLVFLAMLPDLDVLPLAFGAPDRGILGHRGFTHTPVFALAVGVIVALICRVKRTSRPIRIVLLATILVSSHGILDALAQDGRGILFLWPFSMQRFHFPWRPIPDAPVGLAFFSSVGMRHLAIELIYFLPVTFYALWPYRSVLMARPRPSRKPHRGIRRTPQAVPQ